MADTDVDIFLETLKNLITSSKLSSIINEKPQLQSLEKPINYLRKFLNKTEKKREEHSEVMNLVKRIRDVISQAEDIVESFEVCVVNANHEDNLPLDLKCVQKEIKTLEAEVKQILDENTYDIHGVAVKKFKHSSTGTGGGSGSSGWRNPYRGLKDEVVIGFGDDIKTLMGKIHDEWGGGELEIISITGTAGSGKTTLAREVYDDNLTCKKFEIRAWVVVSQDYNKTMKRDLLIGILKSASSRNYDYDEMNEDKLGEQVLKFLSGKKYLIVMDDIWSCEAGNDIQRSFPRRHGRHDQSKVIFTSRQHVQVDGICHIPHFLDPLSETCSWELLENEVFGKKCCPLELVEIGKQIAKKCEGLPLAIIAIAGILKNEEKTLNAWEKIAKHVNSIIATRHEGCMQTLELSYNYLPLHLKVCLLYIGAHPKGYEFQAHELTWLWIAEGFIQQNGEGKSLEAIAKDYLRSLIERNLVMVANKSNAGGGEKICRIHALFRELCLKKAKEDNLFVQIDGDDSSAFSATNKHSRLFIFRQFFNEFFFSRPYPRNLRSFLCLGSGRTRIELHLSFFVETFKLLRVLSFTPDECKGEILRGQLVHLRYLALQLSENTDFRFPFHLVKLETLIVQTSCFKGIKLSSNIFKMVKLRHLYSKQVMFTYHVSCDDDEGNTLGSLQTLQKMCSCKHCLRFLEKTPNLRKLGLYGGGTSDEGILMLPELDFLECLESLSFTNIIGSDIESAAILPPVLKLPSTVTRLTLTNTLLKWEELSTIQTCSLPNLEVLILIDACSGSVWDASEFEGFCNLKYLRIRDRHIKEWHASDDQFPRLEVLVLEYCQKLERIPIAFAELYELREIRVEWCTRSVEESAKEIQDQQRVYKVEENCLKLIAVGNRY